MVTSIIEGDGGGWMFLQGADISFYYRVRWRVISLIFALWLRVIFSIDLAPCEKSTSYHRLSGFVVWVFDLLSHRWSFCWTVLEHDCKGVGALKGVMRTESQLAAIIVFVLALTVFAAETPHHNDRTDHSSPTRSTVDRDTYLYQGPTITPINTHIIFLVHDCGGSSHFQQQWHWAFLPSPWKSGCWSSPICPTASSRTYA